MAGVTHPSRWVSGCGTPGAMVPLPKRHAPTAQCVFGVNGEARGVDMGAVAVLVVLQLVAARDDRDAAPLPPRVLAPEPAAPAPAESQPAAEPSSDPTVASPPDAQAGPAASPKVAPLDPGAPPLDGPLPSDQTPPPAPALPWDRGVPPLLPDDPAPLPGTADLAPVFPEPLPAPVPQAELPSERAPAHGGVVPNGRLPRVPPKTRPPPRVRTLAPAPAWKGAAASGATSLLVVGASGAVAGLVTLLLHAGVMGALIYPASKANPLVCFVVPFGLLPAQGLLFASLALVAPAVAGPLGTWAVRAFARRRVDEIAMVAANALPLALGFVGAGVVHVMGTVGSCFGTTCMTLIAMDRLQTEYGWGNQEAEAWAFRRVAPPVFLGCMTASQVVALMVLSAGGLGSAGLSALVSLWGADPVERPHGIRRRVAPATRAAPAAADSENRLEEDL